MFKCDSPWRNLLHIELSRYTLNGRVADLGGSIKSEYTRFLNGDHAIEIVNMDENTNPDFSFDLEKPLALESGAYDGVLCINTLEHIFDYKNLLSEINRILKNDGTLILAVPFLVQIHPSPNDYFRFSKQSLEKSLLENGFKNIIIKSVGKGPFTAAAQIKFNVLHFNFLRVVSRWIAQLLDSFIDEIVHLFSKKNNYNSDFYPVGYLVIAKNNS